MTTNGDKTEHKTEATSVSDFETNPIEKTNNLKPEVSTSKDDLLDNLKERKSPFTFKNFQSVLGTLSGLIAISYCVGYIIVTTFFYAYGIQGTRPLLNARYLTAGILYLFFAVFAFLFGIVRQYIYFGLFSGVIATAIISVIVPLTFATIFVPTGYTLDFVRGVVIWALISAIGVQDVIILRDMWRAPSRQPSIKLKRGSPSPFRLLTVLGAMLIYALQVYPFFSPIIGGGAPVVVSFITNIENSKVLEQLVPMENEYKTAPLKLLDRTETDYIVLIQNPSGVGEKAVLIDKELIKGLTYPENNSPIRHWVTTPTPTITPSPTFTSTPSPTAISTPTVP